MSWDRRLYQPPTRSMASLNQVAMAARHWTGSPSMPRIKAPKLLARDESGGNLAHMPAKLGAAPSFSASMASIAATNAWSGMQVGLLCALRDRDWISG